MRRGARWAPLTALYCAVNALRWPGQHDLRSVAMLVAFLLALTRACELGKEKWPDRRGRNRRAAAADCSTPAELSAAAAVRPAESMVQTRVTAHTCRCGRCRWAGDAAAAAQSGRGTTSWLAATAEGAAAPQLTWPCAPSASSLSLSPLLPRTHTHTQRLADTTHTGTRERAHTAATAAAAAAAGGGIGARTLARAGCRRLSAPRAHTLLTTLPETAAAAAAAVLARPRSTRSRAAGTGCDAAHSSTCGVGSGACHHHCRCSLQ